MTLSLGFKSDWLLLLLAVANPLFVTRYDDIAFHNNLCRRRLVHDAVRQEVPVAALRNPCCAKDYSSGRECIATRTPDEDREMEIDQLVWESFGLVEETCG